MPRKTTSLTLSQFLLGSEEQGLEFHSGHGTILKSTADKPIHDGDRICLSSGSAFKGAADKGATFSFDYGYVQTYSPDKGCTQLVYPKTMVEPDDKGIVHLTKAGDTYVVPKSVDDLLVVAGETLSYAVKVGGEIVEIPDF